MANSNNTTMLPPDTSGQPLTQAKHAPIGSLSDEPDTQKPTLESVRFRATASAASWNSNEEDLRATTTLLQWRDNCRDEIRDDVLAKIEGCGAQDPLLAAWEKTFDGATSGLLDTIADATTDIGIATTSMRDLAALALAECSLEDARAGKAKTLLYALLRCVEDINDLTAWIRRDAAAQGGAA